MTHTVLYLVSGALVLYMLIGMVVLALWVRRRKARWQTSDPLSPNGSVAFLMPFMIYVEAYSLGSVVVAVPLLLVALPRVSPFIVLAAAGVAALMWTLICVAINRAFLSQVRIRRRQAFPDALL